MQYGVKNYLLKPCNDLKIKEALKEIIDEIRSKEDQKKFVTSLRENMEKAKPYIKTQLLTEFLSGNTHTNRDISYYEELFDIEIGNKKVRLILFQLEGDFGYEHLFAIKNIGEEIFDSLLLNTNVGEYALFLVEDHEEVGWLQQQIQLIRERFFQYYKMDTTIALSDKGYIHNAREQYLEALECLKHRFYLGEGSIITKEDISPGNTDNVIGTMFDEQQICMLIKSGNMNDVNQEIVVFFEKIADLRPEINLAKSYCLRLFLAIVQTGETNGNQFGWHFFHNENEYRPANERIY
jgi:two-component system response regulator YesN